MGCVQEGKECLQEILEAGGQVVGILTFTDDIFEKTSGAVRFDEVAEAHEIPLYKVRTTNSPEAVALIKEISPDAIFVIGWTRLISAEVLKIPKYGCFGMHASLLPRLRGRAPVNWALIKNEKVTGNTMMVLDEGIDTGDIVAQKKLEIRLSDTCHTLYQKVGQAGREMLREFIPKLQEGVFSRTVQADKEAPTMPKRTPEDGLIDWNKPSLELFNWIRALTHPYPGAFTYWRNKRLFIWDARIMHHPSNGSEYGKWLNAGAGQIVSVADGVVVSVGDSELLSIHQMNFAEEPELSWQRFVETYGLQPGERFSEGS